jgi:hypothetical protein
MPRELRKIPQDKPVGFTRGVEILVAENMRTPRDKPVVSEIA